MQVGKALHGIGEGLLIDLGVLRPDPVANGALGSSARRFARQTRSRAPIKLRSFAESVSISMCTFIVFSQGRYASEFHCVLKSVRGYDAS